MRPKAMHPCIHLQDRGAARVLEGHLNPPLSQAPLSFAPDALFLPPFKHSCWLNSASSDSSTVHGPSSCPAQCPRLQFRWGRVNSCPCKQKFWKKGQRQSLTLHHSQSLSQNGKHLSYSETLDEHPASLDLVLAQTKLSWFLVVLLDCRRTPCFNFQVCHLDCALVVCRWWCGSLSS